MPPIKTPSQREKPRPPAKTSKLVWTLIPVTLFAVAAIWIWRSQQPAAPEIPLDAPALEKRAHEKPDDAQAQIEWGAQLARDKRNSEAATVLNHATQLAPSDARPYAWLGVIAAAERRAEEARNLFGMALQHNPDDVTALRGLAYLDALQRRRQNSMEGFQHLVRLNPKDAESWQRLGLLYFMEGQDSRSIEALSKAAALDPKDMLAQRTLGIIYARKAMLPEASRALSQVVSNRPDDTHALAILSLVTMRMDSSPAGLAAAEKQVNKAIETRPTAECYRARGQIYMAQRRFEPAIRDLRVAIRMEPQEQYPYLLLSQCYASTGKSDLARKITAEYERLLQSRKANGTTAPQGNM